jgi:hypothetical protein
MMGAQMNDYHVKTFQTNNSMLTGGDFDPQLAEYLNSEAASNYYLERIITNQYPPQTNQNHLWFIVITKTG